MITAISIILLSNFFIVFYFKRISKFINIFDIPNDNRKIHKVKVANVGGLIFFFNIIIITIFHYLGIVNLVNNVFFLNNYQLIIFFIISSLFFFIGLYDDKFGISPMKKLFLIIFLTFLYSIFDDSILIQRLIFTNSLSISLNSFSIFFTILCFCLFINAFNMFDGINLQSVFYYFFFLIFLTYFYGYNFIFLILIISCLFFLYLNYKNLSFLVNNGSIYLSFILCVFVTKYNSHINYILFSDQIFLLMAIPGLELLRLAIFRILNKKHPFKPDKNHLHHLLLTNFGYKTTFIIIQLIIIIPNILGFYFNLIPLFCLLICIVYFSIILFFKKATKF